MARFLAEHPLKLRIAFWLTLPVALFSVYLGSGRALQPEFQQDFQWLPMVLLIDGYLPSEAYSVIQSHSSEWFLSQAPNYPPSALLFFSPIGWLDWPQAQVAWLIINLASSVIILSLLKSLFFKNSSSYLFPLFVNLFLASTPLRVGLTNGQHALPSMAFFLLVIYLSNRKPIFAGLAMALSWLKFTLTMPLAALVLHPQLRWKTLGWAIGIHVCAVLIVAALCHAQPMEVLIAPLQVVVLAEGFADIFSINQRLGEPLARPFVLTLGVLLWGGSLLTSRNDPNLLSRFCSLCIATLFMTFHGIYDYSLLAVPLAFILTSQSVSPLRICSYAGLTLWVWFGEEIASRAIPFTHLQNVLPYIAFLLLAATYLIDRYTELNSRRSQV